MDEWSDRRTGYGDSGFRRRGECDHRQATAVDLAGLARTRALAGFIGCDARALAEGLLEAVEHDPALRAQRL
jgi:hypothetical protein